MRNVIFAERDVAVSADRTHLVGKSLDRNTIGIQDKPSSGLQNKSSNEHLAESYQIIEELCGGRK